MGRGAGLEPALLSYHHTTSLLIITQHPHIRTTQRCAEIKARRSVVVLFFFFFFTLLKGFATAPKNYCGTAPKRVCRMYGCCGCLGRAAAVQQVLIDNHFLDICRRPAYHRIFKELNVEETNDRKRKLVPWGWASNQYAKNLWVCYKLTLEGFNRLWTDQDGKCAGCLCDFAHPKLKKQQMGVRPDVDHDHKTGKVRGLLCHPCNIFLAKVRDNKELLKRLELYLRQRGEEL